MQGAARVFDLHRSGTAPQRRRGPLPAALPKGRAQDRPIQRCFGVPDRLRKVG
jgi:hypothetical protein